MPDFKITEFLPYLLSQAAEKTSMEFSHHYRQTYGMLRTEWRVLFHLGRCGTMTARQIQDVSGLHKTKISRAVKSLGEKRFLTRSQHLGDGRATLLALTPRGEAAYGDLSQKARLFNEAMVAKLQPGMAEALRRALEDIARK